MVKIHSSCLKNIQKRSNYNGATCYTVMKVFNLIFEIFKKVSILLYYANNF